MCRTKEDGVSVWFWGRDDLSVPDQVRYGHKHVRTVTWGIAEAVFSAENCDMEEYFGLHEIVFDLTFCVSPGLNRDRIYLINSLLF